MSNYRVCLASASPRRQQLLQALGLRPEIRASHVEEPAYAGDSPAEYARMNASAKGHAVFRLIEGDSPPTLVIAADTIVVLDHEVLGKPRGPRDAAAMLRRLRGRSHEVISAVWLRRSDGGPPICDTDSTEVRFRDYDERSIQDYVASGEPMDKAGAYGIQGRGALLSLSIAGSWSNVVGLPLERLPEWLEQLGIELRDLEGYLPASSA